VPLRVGAELVIIDGKGWRR